MEIRDSQKIFCGCNIHQDEDNNNGIMPVYSTSEAACADVALPKQVIIPANSVVKIDLLISFNINNDMKINMYPRSSLLVKKNLVQPVSVIDPDYHDHVHVPLYNPTDEDVVLERGERVAQIECVPRYRTCDWIEKNVKREGGFGSTGK